ncbi:short-chain dehydrogenase [Mycolicibacterium acapulense]|uniref:Short-chain dehydrogenase n=1 Tax=Mycobacterium lehmannii TaxID=2048550 RepID=A0A101A6V8_9MYCO|nr:MULTISPECIES: SDR family oxidoreductase [Mycobacterium]KUI00672.1 short-chain dehydrogenase [Mycolicibacterium acapulense]KUI04913.1 short-chain dehydrogenase [Mycolicibacterium acapulense]KUI12880.1 short-chain dehydrogenase [Mycolicibacterium acapulense]KUI15322.1 short-chain dehydrogenase [Mycobacterium lehmannii]OBB77843.1 short-chain dehydrogenase [Mycobacterium sp. 852014-52144_SCH5372336]
MRSLNGATAVITGGASGIGLATAHSLAKRGARLVIADIHADNADRAVADIRADGHTAEAFVCDVAKEQAFADLGEFTRQRYGSVDIVMNNVGVLTSGRPDHLPVGEWERIIKINLMSVVRSNAVFLPQLISQGHGHIVNTASFAGLYTYSYDRIPYAATKAAIIQISEGLRLYLHPHGIGVTVVCPGPVATNILATMPPTFGPEVQTGLPGEQFGILQPEEVGEQVAEAILNDTFMVYTDDQVRDLLVERATDWNSFIAKQTEKLAQR